MRQSYYFDLVHTDQLIRDQKGVVAESLSQARSEALVEIEMLQNADTLLTEVHDWCLEIRDEKGVFLQSLPLRKCGGPYL